MNSQIIFFLQDNQKSISQIILCFEQLLKVTQKQHKFLTVQIIRMILQRLKPIDQSSEYIQQLCVKNGTTPSCCGYITCAIVQYLSELKQFNAQSDIPKINKNSMTPYIEKAMKGIKDRRKLQVKKFWNQMNQSQRKNYIKDWVANFQIVEYLQSIMQKMVNNQVYFFRQCAYDNPQALKDVKFQQLERTKQQQQFKGQTLFLTKFYPQKKNVRKEQFIEQIKRADQNKPIILATDVLGHFNVTVLFKGAVYILDSLSTFSLNYDQYIVEYIENCYKKSYLKD